MHLRQTCNGLFLGGGGSFQQARSCVPASAGQNCRQLPRGCVGWARTVATRRVFASRPLKALLQGSPKLGAAAARWVFDNNPTYDPYIRQVGSLTSPRFDKEQYPIQLET